jgi:ABC-type iron transport system FetAB ATPase subunit
MDEATSALDVENKQIIYKLIKEYITTLENYTIIYTDHDNTEGFADAYLTIVGQSLEFQ